MYTVHEFGAFTVIVVLLQEGGVTSERVVVLFFFCSDLAIRALCNRMREQFDFITYWSQRYIMESFSIWVQEHGGWVRYVLFIVFIRTLFETSSHDHSIRMLGPLLFLLYINDLPSFVKNQSKPIQFADDTSPNPTNFIRGITTVFEY
jgi:hypothetical protein